MKYFIVLFVIVCSSVYGQADSVYNHPANSRGTIFLSADRGINWTRVDKGLPSDANVNALTMVDQLVVAGTDRHGVYISSDGMKSWYGSSKGLPRTARILSIVFTGNLIFVGTNSQGLFYSDDHGASWRPACKELTNSNIRVLHYSNGFIFAGTDLGLYVSGDEGMSWKLLLGGLQINSMSLQINSMISTKNEVFVATNKGVLRTSDLGKNWAWIFSQGAISSLTYDGTDLYLLDFFGEVYKASKANSVWIKANIFLPFPSTFRITPVGTRFFISDWNKALIGIDSTEEVFRAKGIPEDLFIGELLDTPFGVLAAVGGGGC
jgi:photosystem II stability/assembly factor-like uncharacterized protein